MVSHEHTILLFEAMKNYEEKGFSHSEDDCIRLRDLFANEGYRPDFIMSNDTEIVVIEAVHTSDRCRPDLIEEMQPLFNKKIRLDKKFHAGRNMTDWQIKAIGTYFNENEFRFAELLRKNNIKEAAKSMGWGTSYAYNRLNAMRDKIEHAENTIKAAEKMMRECPRADKFLRRSKNAE